jgi:hypothetical protein
MGLMTRAEQVRTDLQGSLFGGTWGTTKERYHAQILLQLLVHVIGRAVHGRATQSKQI